MRQTGGRQGKARRAPWAQRVNAWVRRHRNVVDFSSALLLLIIPALLSEETGCSGLLLGQPEQAGLWWTLAYALPLSLRHRHPDLCAWLTLALLAVRLPVGPLLLIGDLAALTALFAAIARGDPGKRWWYAALGVTLPALFASLDALAQARAPLLGRNSTRVTSPAFDIVPALIGMILATATIAYARHQAHVRRQATLLRQRNRALALSTLQEEQEAAIAERSRLARDMHDVAAHTLSILIVLADGGRYAGAHDPSLALSTMRTIHKQADNSLKNTTSLLKPFGKASCPHARAAHPSYTHIDALVQEARESVGGRLVVDRRVEGHPDETVLATHALLSETLYRMVEEALSNIRKYSGLAQGRRVHALIEEAWGPRRVHVTVRDDGRGSDAVKEGHRAGYGLIGMRERVEACGGILSARPLPKSEGGGFQIAADIPLPKAQPARGDKPSRNIATLEVGPPRFSPPDIIMAACICLLAAMAFLPGVISRRNAPFNLVNYAGAVCCAIPLVFLHPYPERPAIITASAMGATIIADGVLREPLPVLPLACGLWALYSVVAFGPRHARRWVRPACVILVLLAACVTLTSIVFGGGGSPTPSPWRLAAVGVGALTIYGSTVLIVLAVGELHRDRGEDPVLLAERRQALLEEREQAGRLAARRERERVSAQIQKEVARTLKTMSDEAGTAVRRLEAIDRRSRKRGAVSGEDSATIIRLFAQTSDTGRHVLAHIRELIGILRRNETEKESARVPLTPLPGTPQSGMVKIKDDAKASQAPLSPPGREDATARRRP